METNDDKREHVRVRLDLTEEQRAHVRDKLGIDRQAIELAIEPLEDRVTPIIAVLIG